MKCKKCGTEIAEKALVCFRCGTATFEPVVKPPTGRARPGSRLPTIAALLVLVLAALYMSQAAAGQAPRFVSWVIAGLAVVVLAWRLIVRRRP
ncbi:MAG: zinc ribbon domain-containing protein [Acidobacteria bacterium]|nr:MAG: zinc ribbon domain-containing protein [Acidobacteriota bacterium]RPJ74620.1 MAG: zinc ribbon domain-containing protein [Acidobacteriota bacterium]